MNEVCAAEGSFSFFLEQRKMNPIVLREKGVIPCFMGGLGNQLFILAAAYVVHRRTGMPLYLFQTDPAANKHNRARNNYCATLFKEFGIPISTDLRSSVLGLLRAGHYQLHGTPTDGFLPWNPASIAPGTCLTSYYQYYPPLAPYASELRRLLLLGLEPQLATLRSVVSEPAAFLHVRRGDYVGLQQIHPIQPIEYYQEAVKRLLATKRELKRIYVVSDDVAWVKEQPFFQTTLFQILEGYDELQTLALMSLCSEGAICANSTFSWWGAYLGASAAGNPVCVPSHWISTAKPSLFPSEWSTIEVSAAPAAAPAAPAPQTSTDTS